MSPNTIAVTLALLAVAFRFATAETLTLKLEPALDFHSVTGDLDLLFFKVVEPQSNPSCEGEICGGTVSVDFSQYDAVEFSFEAPEGKEIMIQSNEDNRVRLEFQATAACDSLSPPFLDISGEDISISFMGSDVETLVSNLDSTDSFVQVGKCQEGCSLCEIFTRLELDGSGTGFTGKATKMSWTISYDPTVFDELGALDYRYDTNGYCWIRTPFDSAIVDGPTTADSPAPTPSTGPAPSPTDSPTSGGAAIIGVKNSYFLALLTAVFYF